MTYQLVFHYSNLVSTDNRVINLCISNINAACTLSSMESYDCQTLDLSCFNKSQNNLTTSMLIFFIPSLTVYMFPSTSLTVFILYIILRTRLTQLKHSLY